MINKHANSDKKSDQYVPSDVVLRALQIGQLLAWYRRSAAVELQLINYHTNKQVTYRSLHRDRNGGKEE